MRANYILSSHKILAVCKMPQIGAPYIHSGDPAYAPPLLRAPSPSSSIGTDYGPDETSYEDAHKSQNQFVNDIQARLKLNEPRMEEAQANRDPLLPKPKDPQEEQGALCACFALESSSDQVTSPLLSSASQPA